MHSKADLYLSGGAEQVWLVYPKSRTVTVLDSQDSQYTVHSGSQLTFTCLPPHPPLTVEVSRFFHPRSLLSSLVRPR